MNLEINNSAQKSAIYKEMELNRQPDYVLGSNLYLGMAYVGDKKVCISIGYTLTYCIKKANEFIAVSPNIRFAHVSKVKTGEKVACEKFYLEEQTV
jgi:hypothetical protein